MGTQVDVLKHEGKNWALKPCRILTLQSHLTNYLASKSNVLCSGQLRGDWLMVSAFPPSVPVPTCVLKLVPARSNLAPNVIVFVLKPKKIVKVIRIIRLIIINYSIQTVLPCSQFDSSYKPFVMYSIGWVDTKVGKDVISVRHILHPRVLVVLWSRILI